MGLKCRTEQRVKRQRKRQKQNRDRAEREGKENDSVGETHFMYAGITLQPQHQSVRPTMYALAHYY
jgi:hypothetical protein